MSVPARPRRSRLLVLVLSLAVLALSAACGRLTSEEAAGDGGDRGATAAPPATGGSDPGSAGGGAPGSTGGAGSGSGGGVVSDCESVPPSDAGPDTPVCHDVDQGDPGDVVDPPAPSPVEPRPGMANVRPIGWEDATVDGRTVTITYWSGVEPCYVLDHVDVAYGDDTITVTLYEGSDPDGGDTACIEIAMHKSVAITLDQDVAGRAIVDGAGDPA